MYVSSGMEWANSAVKATVGWGSRALHAAVCLAEKMKALGASLTGRRKSDVQIVRVRLFASPRERESERFVRASICVWGVSSGPTYLRVGMN
jgi:hypothetical protein